MAWIKPKFAGGSWSIIGGLGLLATIAAPFISAWTGIDITEDDIASGTSAIDGAIKGIAGAFSFALLLYGRKKAGMKLQPITFNPLGANPVKVEVKTNEVVVVAKKA